MPGSLRRATLIALTLVASALTPVPTAWATVPVPVDVHDGSSWQGGPSHDGHSDALLGDHPTLRWTVRLPGHASAPVFGPGAVYVAASFDDRSAVYALSPDDGSVIWGPRFLLGPTPAVAYGQGLVVTQDDSGDVQAWDATTGAQRWVSRQESMRFAESVTVADGLVFIAGNVGVTALDLFSGAVRWVASTVSMNQGVAVSDGIAVVDGACDQAYGFNALNGAQAWHHETTCAGGGGVTPSIHQGLVNLHEQSNGFDVDLETGTQVTADGNDATPAYDGVNEYDVAGGRFSGHAPLRARTAGITRWTSTNDYTRLPYTVTGQVVAVAVDGRVDGLSQDDGSVLWSSPAPTDTVTPGDEWAPYYAGANALGDELAVSYGRVIRAFTPAASIESALPVTAPVAVPAPVRTSAGPRGTTWTQVGGGSRHDGDLSAEPGHSPWARAWEASRPGPVSQVAIVPGAVVSLSSLSTDQRGGWQLWAQDPATGDPLWAPVTIDAGGEDYAVSWRLAAGDGLVVVSNGGLVKAYSIATGQLAWGTYGYGYATVEDDLAYVGNSVLDLQSGTRLYDGSALPAVDQRQVYSGYSRYDEGEQVWTGGPLSSLTASVNDTRVLSRYQTDLGAVTLDRDSGAVTSTVPGRWLPAMDGTMVVHGQDADVVADELDTQLPMWVAHLDDRVAAQPVLTATEVLVLDTRGTVYALDRTTGSERWRATVPGAASVQQAPWLQVYEPNGIAVAQGLLVVHTAKGFVVFTATGSVPSAGSPDSPGTPLPLVDVVSSQPKVIGQSTQTHVTVVAGPRSPEPVDATVDVTIRDATGAKVVAVLAPQPDGTYRNDAIDVSLLKDGPLRLQARSHLGTSAGRALPATVTTKDTVGPHPTMYVVGGSTPSGVYTRIEMLQFWSDTDLSARPVVTVTANGTVVPGHSEWYGDYGAGTTYFNWGPDSFSQIVPGHYVVAVTATDTYGNPTTTTTYSFDVLYDNTPPTVGFTQVPPSTTTDRAATISYAITQPGTPTTQLATWCRIDSEATPCDAKVGESTVTFASLPLGTHTFSVTASDEGGQATATTTWTITDGSSPSPSPSATASPTATGAPTAPTTAVSGPPPFLAATSASWRASSTGTGTHDFRWRSAPYDGTATTFAYPTAWQGTAATTVTRTVPAGSTMCVSARTRDASGAAGPWSADRCTSGLLDDRALTAGQGWTRITASGYTLRTATATSVANADLRLAGVRARHLALVATTCDTCGSVKVYVGSTLIRTVSLGGHGVVHGHLIDLGDLGAMRTGTLTLRSTSTRRVWVEGVGISAV